MKTTPIKISSLAVATALLAAGCENMSPGENAAVFGTMGAVAGSSIASAAGANYGQSLAIGAGTGAVIAMTAYIVSVHQATERQRRIAEMRAREYYERQSEERKAALKKKKVRYIAVDTVKDKDTAPDAKKSVMIWDTQSEQVVGNNVYDVKSTPEVGQTAKFETYSATYVGSGG